MPADRRTMRSASYDDVDSIEGTAGARIILTKFTITDKALQLEYEIKNDSDHEIWVCQSADELGEQYKVFEAFLDLQRRTLIIRKRLDVPMLNSIDRMYPPSGRYVRLRPGESCSELLSHELPFYPHIVYYARGNEQGIEYARRLAIEIGFYDEDLPALIRTILTEADRFTGTLSDRWWLNETITGYFAGLALKSYMGGGVDWFNQSKGASIEKGTLVIPYNDQTLKGERVLHVTVDGVFIPYNEQGG